MKHKEYLQMVGMEFKIARIRAKMTVKQVSKLSGLCDNSINEVESGKNDSHILTYKRIADVLGVELKDLM